jgi:hypothetical protein
MGADFSSHWFFVGAGDPSRTREILIHGLYSVLRDAGFDPTSDKRDADRTLVVGPAGRWVFVGDSAGSTEWADPEAFADLSRRLSVFGPVPQGRRFFDSRRSAGDLIEQLRQDPALVSVEKRQLLTVAVVDEFLRVQPE